MTSHTETATAATVVDEMMDAANTHVDSTEIRTEYTAQHRYLQGQAFFEIIKPIILALADTEQSGYDRRNKEAVRAAQDIVECMNWDDEI